MSSLFARLVFVDSFWGCEYVLNLCEWLMCLTAVTNQSPLLDYRAIPCFQTKGGILWKDTAGGRSRTELIVLLSKQSWKGMWHHPSVDNCWGGCYAPTCALDFVINACEDTMWTCRVINPASLLLIWRMCAGCTLAFCLISTRLWGVKCIWLLEWLESSAFVSYNGSAVVNKLTADIHFQNTLTHLYIL